jgi:hypothetical protein
MSGIDAVGSFPVGSTGGSTFAGASYAPAPASFLFGSGGVPTITYSVPPVRVTQVPTEVLHAGGQGAVNVTATPAEVLHAGAQNYVRVSATPVEVLHRAQGPVRVTGAYVEVLHSIAYLANRWKPSILRHYARAA